MATNNPINVGSLTNGQLWIGSTGAKPVAASLTAGANITITPGAGSLEIASSGGGGGVTWVEATDDLTMAAGNIYISNGASSNTFTLPATAAVGDTFGAYVGSQPFSIAQNSGQYILLAANQTTTGTGGSIDSGGSPGQGLQFTCITANETFMITAMSGGVTFN